MGSKELLIFYVPDANPDKNKCMLETPSSKLFVMFVSNQKEAIHSCKKFIKEEGVDCIILCPHFTNEDISEIREAIGEKVELFQISVKKR